MLKSLRMYDRLTTKYIVIKLCTPNMNLRVSIVRYSQYMLIQIMEIHYT